ncbi:MAG: aminodeoxychorismate synthase component I [Planctomycetes bacterium]|nr:aminodeoxychorismate synthase component I [Planctomycetota bacterium]
MILPSCKPIATGITLPRDYLDYYPSLARHPFPFVIDGAGDTSLIGSNPYRVLIAKGDRVTDWRAGRKHVRRANPLDVLRDALAEHPMTDHDVGLPFVGGAVGYFGYDLARQIERLPEQADDDRGFPDLFLAFYDRAVVVRHDAHRAAIVELNEREPERALNAEQYEEEFRALGPLRPDTPSGSNFTRDAYLLAIERVRDYIAAGDAYQVNLSQRFHARATAPPFEIYRRLREAAPAPYSAYLEFGRRAIVSSSPELFLDVRDRRVVTRPIKGTRRRGETLEEDERLRAELLNSEKDNAELSMIVDLERNDLGRICEVGSVRVTEPLALETHPNVHHLVATVEGRLQRDANAVDLLRATFPSGSVTGAPKIRAMEIIDELEPTRRAAYTGAIGFIGFDGAMTLSVAIRIIEIHGDDLWFQVGGGIVWDSDPAAEYEETLVKGSAIARAVGATLR